MNRILLSVFTAALFSGVSLAQTAAQAQASGSASESSSVSANQSGAQVQSQTGAQAASQGALSTGEGNNSAQASSASQLASGSTIHAQLEKPVDARKCKPGDEVVAKTTQNVKSNGETVLPKGSKIIGHVTEAKARAKGQSESALGIAFDHAVLKDGREVPLAASIQAISSSQASSSADLGNDSLGNGSAMAGKSTSGMASGGASPAGGVLGGSGRAVGTTGGVLTNTAGSLGGSATGAVGGAASASGALTSSSHGVVGLKGLSLDSAAANSTQGSVISSTTQNVHLDSGTQMILQVAGK